MTESRQREMWNHTASVLAMLINLNRDPKRSRAIKPTELHPLHERGGSAIVARVGVEALRHVFVNNEETHV